MTNETDFHLNTVLLTTNTAHVTESNYESVDFGVVYFTMLSVLSRFRDVTIDGVWIAYWIY
jgi:hypothetical protein